VTLNRPAVDATLPNGETWLSVSMAPGTGDLMVATLSIQNHGSGVASVNLMPFGFSKSSGRGAVHS
jgi:hypothetical protein